MKILIRCLLCCVVPLGTALAQEGEQPSAVAAPPSSLELSSDRTPGERIAFLLDVAQAYVTEKDYDAAIDAYERILKIDPTNQQARYIIAHIYISAKQYKKAETMLLELVNETPEDFKLWNNLAWLYATADDLTFRDGTKAISCAHEAMTLAPDDYHVWST
ncbi:MAG: tetratricopeptide repeat protein, partial [Kiritimatiellales bacterium]|nr:tetratricopeptide repeat protein [Kiritimatiellales bacterium]